MNFELKLPIFSVFKLLSFLKWVKEQVINIIFVGQGNLMEFL